MAVQRIRFTISIDRDVYKQVKDYRFEARFETMSRAAEELIIRGLRSYYEEEKAILEQEPENTITAKEAFGEGV